MPAGSMNYHPLRLVVHQEQDARGTHHWRFTLRCGHVVQLYKTSRPYLDSNLPRRCRCVECYDAGQRDHDHKPNAKHPQLVRERRSR